MTRIHFYPADQEMHASLSDAEWPIAQQAVRDEMVRVGASLFQRGLVHSTAGNISVRLTDDEGGGVLMTPTDACLGFLCADRLAWVSEQGQQRTGDPASKTLTSPYLPTRA
jgi:ribulose-5-phosphate 4-epimerase/fuculose-1-phosphate aldolase